MTALAKDLEDAVLCLHQGDRLNAECAIERAVDHASALSRGFEALALMVRDDYPTGLTLTEIAETWGSALGVTREQVDALRALEASS